MAVHSCSAHLISCLVSVTLTGPEARHILYKISPGLDLNLFLTQGQFSCFVYFLCSAPRYFGLILAILAWNAQRSTCRCLAFFVIVVGPVRQELHIVAQASLKLFNVAQAGFTLLVTLRCLGPWLLEFQA